jgi:hypothetical protein
VLQVLNGEEGRFFTLLKLLLDNRKEFHVKICILHKFTVMQIFLTCTQIIDNLHQINR